MSDLIFRLRKRAEIRRQIVTRKSVQEKSPDRISDLLEEAADELQRLQEARREALEEAAKVCDEYQYDDYMNDQRGTPEIVADLIRALAKESKP